MNQYKDNYSNLVEKLDEFIRKYYKDQLIRGGLYSSSMLLIFYLSVTLLEHFGHFGITLRTFLFYSFSTGLSMILWYFIFTPLFGLYRIRKTISYEEAASIIGKHFPEIRDKLLNVLQLTEQKNASHYPEQLSLLEAGIDQKIRQFKFIPFGSAIQLSRNLRYIKYAAIPLFVLIGILLSSPSLITESTARLIKHSTYYEVPAPFHFTILNQNLQAIQQEDFVLEVKVNGTELPESIYLESDGTQYKLEKENNVSFRYLFRNIQKNIQFRLSGDGYTSRPYELVVLPNPVVLSFSTKLAYPPYLHKADEELKNTGDLSIPAGTTITWLFKVKNTDVMRVSFQHQEKDLPYSYELNKNNDFTLSKRFLKSNSYTINTSNAYLKSRDSILYSLAVIPDLYPAIQVEQQADSFSAKRLYFKGIVKDDYGFTRLTFNYHFLKLQASANEQAVSPDLIHEENIPVNKQINQDQFFYYHDFSSMSIAPGDEVEYYFEIWDNDGVSGSKSVRSPSFIFKAPTEAELAEGLQKKNDALKQDFRETIREAKALQQDLEELERKLFDKKTMSWEDKKKAEDLLKRQKDLQEKVEDMKKQDEQNFSQQSEYKKVSEEVIKKHEQLQQLMQQIMTDEMKKLFEELEKVLQQADKEKVEKMLDKMKMDNKDVEKELDRSLEIFKQLEFEQKFGEKIEKLEQLAKDQEQLAKETENKKENNEELKKKQEDLTGKFQDLQKDLQELEKKNEALEFPNDFKNPEEEQKDIKQDMQNSEQQLSEGKNKKASQSQKDASGKMKELSKKLSAMKSASDSEELEEDMKALRMLLENLVKLSFDQESLMEELQTTDVNNPRYLKIAQKQKGLQDDSKMIEDSLFALSKRVAQISSTVNREISEINQDMAKALDDLEDRNVYSAKSRQQFTMTSVNNLALLLNEVLSALQKQMASQMQGDKACKKPGGKKPSPNSSGVSMSKIREIQQQISKQIESLKKGASAGGKQGMSEQLARLAAQQEALRNELQQFNQQENKDGRGSYGKLDQLAKQMEDNETDLVNKLITQETLKRQQEILTRLLESENAEREREQDQKRHSEEGKNYEKRNPSEFEEYKRLKQKETELLKTIPPSLNIYYKQKVNEYFQILEN